MAQWYAQVNGQRFGPASEEEMRSWISQGRVKPADYVWSEGMANWVTAASAFGMADPAAAAGGGVSYQPVPSVQPNAPYAVASMVCGIISCVVWVCYGVPGLVLGIIALVLGNKGRAAIEANPNAYGGQGMVTAGRVTGIIGIIVSILYVIAVICWIAFVVNAVHSSRTWP